MPWSRKTLRMHWTFIFGRHSTLRLPLYLTCLKAVSPGSSISPLSEGKSAVLHLAPYCVSKFALVGLSDALRAELSAKNIFVTTVAPGLLRTGSHKNAYFKGQHRKEFTWFSLGASSPLLSMDADRAACQILEAVRSRRPELTITFAARLGAIAQALLPNVTASLMKLSARLLPRMPIQPENKTYTGWESGSTLSPSLLTRIADRATKLYNGLRNHPSSR